MSITGECESSMWRAYRCPVPRAQERIRSAILGGGDLGFGFEDGVDAADCGRLGRCVILGGGGFNSGEKLPLLATSVATSNRMWFCTSRAPEAIAGVGVSWVV